MIRGPFLDRNWMGQNPDYNLSNVVMLGLPLTVQYHTDQGHVLHLSK